LAFNHDMNKVYYKYESFAASMKLVLGVFTTFEHKETKVIKCEVRASEVVSGTPLANKLTSLVGRLSPSTLTLRGICN